MYGTCDGIAANASAEYLKHFLARQKDQEKTRRHVMQEIRKKLAVGCLYNSTFLTTHSVAQYISKACVHFTFITYEYVATLLG
jgi:hypothetical protein